MSEAYRVRRQCSILRLPSSWRFTRAHCCSGASASKASESHQRSWWIVIFSLQSRWPPARFRIPPTQLVDCSYPAYKTWLRPVAWKSHQRSWWIVHTRPTKPGCGRLLGNPTNVFATGHFVERQLERDELELFQRCLRLEVHSLGRALDVQVIVPHHLSSPESGLEFSRDELDSDLVGLRVVSNKRAIERERFSLKRIRECLICGDRVSEDSGRQSHTPIKMLIDSPIQSEPRAYAKPITIRGLGHRIEALVPKCLTPEPKVAAESYRAELLIQFINSLL